MVKHFKGYNYTGCTILGYRLVPIRDYGEDLNMSFDVRQTGIEHQNNFNCNKKIRKVTYRKFLKSANRE